MKRGVINHRKTRWLSEELGIPRSFAVGILHCLFEFCGDASPRGDIGRHSNKHIADEVFWAGDPDVLIRALENNKWLDPDPEYRYLIHGWSEHCEDFIHTRLARQHKLFANGDIPRLKRMKVKEQEDLLPILTSIKNDYERSKAHKSAMPSHAMPSLAQPSQAKPVAVERSRALNHEPPAALWRQLTLTCGEVPINQTSLDKWKEQYPHIDVEYAISKFEKKYQIEPIEFRSVLGKISTWLKDERPEKDKPQEINSPRDLGEGEFKLSSEIITVGIEALVTRYESLIRWRESDLELGRDGAQFQRELDNLRDGSPDKWQAIQDFIAQRDRGNHDF